MSTIGEMLAKKGSDVATISPGATALDAANLMNARRIGALCVLDKDKLVGVFTERDLLNRVVSAQLDPARTKIADIMTTDVITCGPNGKTEDCASVMSHERVRHLPVVENGRLVGLISTGDLMALQVAEKQAFIEDLYQYLHGRT
ncbi:MAG: CBS domain-containing protein [Planctomycetes bacterium]|nr:CBS domain-containing protein [Planctomycetota bacterium]